MEIFKTEIVHQLPDKLIDGALYVSLKYKTVAHLCACGCGEEVITPLSKKRGWVMKYDGHYVSLKPSVGNWNLNCKSHYWIKNNRVEWCINDTGPVLKSKKGFIKKILNWMNG